MVWMFKSRAYFLLASLLGLIVVYPAWPGPVGKIVGLVFLLLIPIAGALAVRVGRRALVVGFILAGLCLAATIYAAAAAQGGALRPTGFAAAAMMFYYAFTTRRLALHLLSARRVDQDVLVSAACVYLLTGLIFAFAYLWVAIDIPGALTASSAAGPIRLPDLIYFSFVTLTTLGYGDIAPVASIARSLAILEATFGVMYLATIIARVVSLYSAGETGRE